MKILFVLLLLILFIPLPGLTEGLFNYLWNIVPGTMTLVMIGGGMIYLSLKVNRFVFRIETLEKDVNEFKVSVDKRFESLEKKMDERFEKVEARLDKLDDKVTRIMEILLLGKNS